MKEKQDISLIIAITILMLFCILTAIYYFSNNSLNDNSSNNSTIDSNIENTIYEESTYEQEKAITKKEYVQIASYTTNIYDKDNNRIFNIKKACNVLDGIIVKPGEEFSFNKTMGNMGKIDGYKEALGFDSNGNKIQVFGGGICQISSTLYNCILIAKLEVTERHAHSRRVYYVPKNKDATVFAGGPDLKFINNTSSNIMICTSTDGYTVTVSLKQEKA